MTSQEFAEKYIGREVKIIWREEVLDGIVNGRTMEVYNHAIQALTNYVCINDADGRVFMRIPKAIELVDKELIDKAPLPLPG